ncbi:MULTISPECIES: META domain-containing protein [Acinetobacter]|uniref:META domain-containing protein n=1 Tax=Acinetobacter piscicola TaxID=2006115 RepID=A0A4Q4H2P8_9GAMM|nr:MULTISPECIES: META domain-containing protein [Acinetobacter]MDM1756880.1 META domain-containing protein [Acinetobacter sp. 256-1]MDM1759931.1 META domain-containing protein [Acinetobacter sp. 251-1]QOW47321.1 META domain-containing protein [Acinetobacter piscicola]RYL29334.1 META domain-containing protein [Acinetobacter piscicola]
MLKNLLWIGIVSTAIVGCTTTTQSVQQQENLAVLQNKTWVMTHIGATEFAKKAETPMIQFGSDLRVSGSDGCNRIMGNYAVKNHHLNLGDIASTKMLCPNNQDIVAKYHTALKKVMGYQAYDQTLKLLDQHGNVVLQYHTAP